MAEARGESGSQRDVAIIGGGPAGSTAALCCARRGLSVILLEKQTHPRFVIGESLLPRNWELFEELGLLETVAALPHVAKYGASFVMAGDSTPSDFWFPPRQDGAESRTLNIERALLDRALLDQARQAGAEVWEAAPVQRIEKLALDDVRLATPRGTVRSRILLDASGQATVVARHLGIRQVLPDLRRAAYFAHFTGEARETGRLGGFPLVVICSEGWFWVIPINEQVTSVGLVIDPAAIRQANVPAAAALAWGIERCPFLRRRLSRASGPQANQVCADFAYRCTPCAGPGYFLLGDAAAFVDPIFSTGVCLSMMSAVQAARLAGDIIMEQMNPSRAARAYQTYLRDSSEPLFRMVRRFYRQGFRDMLLHGKGPFAIHEAVLSLLAGRVFPRPAWRLRWRMALLDALLLAHERVRPLVPQRPPYSLLAAEAASPVEAAS